MACPDVDCHDKVKDVCKLVHSQTEGLPSKVDKKSVTKWTLAVIGYGITILVVLALAWGAAKDERNENKRDIALNERTMELGFKAIDEKLDSLVKSQEKIWKVVSKKKDNNE